MTLRTNRREACFNMASDNTSKLMLAKVLNSARAANILDENYSDGVRGLTTDYFSTVRAVEGEDAVDRGRKRSRRHRNGE